MAEVQRAQAGAAELAFIDVPPAAGAPARAHPVLLIHGFASNHVVNWVNTSWIGTLTRAGYRVVAFDNRGHGQSQKFHRPQDYGIPAMAEDARGLLDELGIERAYVMGYSMGARIAVTLALAHPERVVALLLGGHGVNLVNDVGLPSGIAGALEAPSLADLSDPTQRMFRAFAEQTGSDLVALAACVRGSRQTFSREQMGAIRVPTLVSVGTRDDIAGSGPELAALIPGAQALDIPGRDHNLAVGDRTHKEGVLAFLDALPPD